MIPQHWGLSPGVYGRPLHSTPEDTAFVWLTANQCFVPGSQNGPWHKAYAMKMREKKRRTCFLTANLRAVGLARVLSNPPKEV
jgi:hypothetical protein